MNLMEIICGRCGATSERFYDKGILTDPSGWSELTISGRPIRNMRLCTSCTEAHKTFLSSPLLST